MKLVHPFKAGFFPSGLRRGNWRDVLWPASKKTKIHLVNCLWGSLGKELWVASRSCEWFLTNSKALKWGAPSCNGKKMNSANNQQAWKLSTASGENCSPGQHPDIRARFGAENPATPHLDFGLQNSDIKMCVDLSP